MKYPLKRAATGTAGATLQLISQQLIMTEPYLNFLNASTGADESLVCQWSAYQSHSLPSLPVKTVNPIVTTVFMEYGVCPDSKLGLIDCLWWSPVSS